MKKKLKKKPRERGPIVADTFGYQVNCFKMTHFEHFAFTLLWDFSCCITYKGDFLTRFQEKCLSLRSGDRLTFNPSKLLVSRDLSTFILSVHRRGRFVGGRGSVRQWGSDFWISASSRLSSPDGTQNHGGENQGRVDCPGCEGQGRRQQIYPLHFGQTRRVCEGVTCSLPDYECVAIAALTQPRTYRKHQFRRW